MNSLYCTEMNSYNCLASYVCQLTQSRSDATTVQVSSHHPVMHTVTFIKQELRATGLQCQPNLLDHHPM